VYARNSEGVWSHESYFWTATGATTPPPTGTPIDPLLILGGVSIAGVVVVVGLIWFRKR
jgi:hypothetical protein